MDEAWREDGERWKDRESLFLKKRKSLCSADNCFCRRKFHLQKLMEADNFTNERGRRHSADQKESVVMQS